MLYLNMSKNSNTSRSKHRRIYKISLGKEFLDMTQKHNPQKKTMTNYTSTKCKIFAIWKSLLKKLKIKATDWEKDISKSCIW